MRLSLLFKNVVSIPAEADCDIDRLTLDSRQIRPRDAFVAFQGVHLDGRQFIKDAIERGASAILIDGDHLSVSMSGSIPMVMVPNLKQQAGKLAARFYGYPSQALHLIGVTGTNGKTSCTHFTAQVLQSLQIPCGIIGTLGSGFYGALGEAGLTTPDAVSLQASLRQFVDKGAKAVAMEVSSHSIDQGRIQGVTFETAIFTNLTQDHLDYHGDMATYAAVKRRFAVESPVHHRVINADDAYGREWLQALAGQNSVYAYALQNDVSIPANIPLIYTSDAHFTLRGIHAVVHTPWGQGDLNLPLIGQFNLSNALAVLVSLCLYGVSLPNVLAAFSRLAPVAGRMQTIGGDGMPLVVVDYAHTPDALEKVLQALRAHTQGKLICVFGCGGDRDSGKRPLMGRIAEQWADHVIITNDNPRHEEPDLIAGQIVAGLKSPDRAEIELDRSQAIEKSIQLARSSDCILIAGKGAERYQQIGDRKISFDDVQQAKGCLEKYWQHA